MATKDQVDGQAQPIQPMTKAPDSDVAAPEPRPDSLSSTADNTARTNQLVETKEESQLKPVWHEAEASDTSSELAHQRQPGHQGKAGAPAVRLDMNLDVEVELKAKIEGDITLSLP